MAKKATSKYRKIRKIFVIPAEFLPAKAVSAKLVKGTVEIYLTVPEKTVFDPVDLGIDPQAGHNRFFIANRQLGVYTCIGADNIHHASNKCTKLFGPHWSFLREEHNCAELRGYVHCPVAEFNRLINTLQI